MDWNDRKESIIKVVTDEMIISVKSVINTWMDGQLDLIKPLNEETEMDYKDEISDLTAEIDGLKAQMDTIVDYTNSAQSYLGDIESSLNDIESEAYHD